MTSLIAYRRVVTPVTTHSLRLPDAPQGLQAGQELCTLPDGRTVVALFVGYSLPANQPSEITDSIETLAVPLPSAMRAAICATSPQVQLINKMVRDAIAERYSMADEIKLLRTAPSNELTAYSAHAEACRATGRAEKTKLGL